MKKLFAALFAVCIGGSAHAATIDGGTTDVTVTADLASLGLGGAPFGTATVAGATFTFPITGGSVASSGALIEHDGSGVTLSALAAPATAVTVGNFLIDTNASKIFGDVIGGTSGLDLFDLGAGDATGIQLNITSTLAGALTSIFNAPDLTGAEFGRATTAPEVVPLPAGGVLLLSGLVAFGALRRRTA